MRLSTTPSTAALLLALPSLAAAADPSWACTTVQDGIKYDLSSLKGTHQVFDINETPPTVTNTTWQINPCESILKDVKDQPKDQCTAGTYGLDTLTHSRPPVC